MLYFIVAINRSLKNVKIIQISFGKLNCRFDRDNITNQSNVIECMKLNVETAHSFTAQIRLCIDAKYFNVSKHSFRYQVEVQLGHQNLFKNFLMKFQNHIIYCVYRVAQIFSESIIFSCSLSGNICAFFSRILEILTL